MKTKFPILILILLTGCQSYKIENGKWSFVQWNEGVGRMVLVVDSADQNSFTPINRDYAKDRYHVFIWNRVIEGADPITFVYLGNDYSKDNQRVFFQAKEIKSADPNTFQIIEYGWSKDKNDAYAGIKPLKVVDLSSFKILHVGILNDWAKDKSDYYFSGHTGKIDCDYPTMKILNGSYAIDKSRAFFDGIPIEGVDVKTFRAIDENSAKDCYRDYLLERPRANFFDNNAQLVSPP